MPHPLDLKVDPQNNNLISKLSQLESYDFGFIKTDVMKKLNWPQEKADYVERRVKMFFSLAFLDQGNYHIPEVDVDEFWHRMILHTMWYVQFCDDIFSEYYHHTPEPDQKHLNQANRQRSRDLIKHWYADSWDFIIMTCTQCRGPYKQMAALAAFAPAPAVLPKI